MPITTTSTLKGKGESNCHRCGKPSPIMRVISGTYVCQACDPRHDDLIQLAPEPEVPAPADPSAR
jgi:ribosomal protein L37AE/L43A